MVNNRKYNFEKYEFENIKFRDIFEKILKDQKYLHNALFFLSEIKFKKKRLILREEKLFNCFQKSIKSIDSNFLLSLQNLVNDIPADEPWERSYVINDMDGILQFIDKRKSILNYKFKHFLTKNSGLETFADIKNICNVLCLCLSDLNFWVLRNFSTNYERNYEEWWDIDYKNPEMDELEYLSRFPKEFDYGFSLIKEALEGECIKWYETFNTN